MTPWQDTPLGRPGKGLRHKVIREGNQYIWATGAAVTVTLFIVVGLLGVVMVKGLGYYWVSALHEATLADGTRVLGEITGREYAPDGSPHSYQFKTGNRDLYGRDFLWIDAQQVTEFAQPDGALLLERLEFGNFYGYVLALDTPTLEGALPGELWAAFNAAHRQGLELRQGIAEKETALSEISVEMEALRLRGLKMQYAQRRGEPLDSAELQRLQTRSGVLRQRFESRSGEVDALMAHLRLNTVTLRDANGEQKILPLMDIVRILRPNTMSPWAKAGLYAARLGELLWDNPRESNTEGGLFPAIYGTVMMVLLMSVFSLPLGVIAAIYLREYAKEGLLVRLVRIAVYNLAGVPSIVFGVFGLGFFVYGVGGMVDRAFFAEQLPTPTFGTGGILWASLTLALLTVPVVIVATEEGLSAIPKGLREGSLALGATQFQTVMRVVMPMAVPGILTGFILAMARAVGEVAPLMITGVVKLAPSLPLDGTFPYLHLERKFMHLGFHIYDVGFQSPNVEAAKPMVYVTTLLLILIVLMMSMVAILLRNRMRKRFQGATF